MAGPSFNKLMAIVSGICLIIPFGCRLYTHSVFTCQSVSVEGVVVKSLRGRDIGGRALVEYKDPNGNVYEVPSKYKIHWFFAPTQGEQIGVRFMANDPEIAIVDSLFHYIFVPSGCIVVGIALIFSAVRRDRKRREHSPSAECRQ